VISDIYTSYRNCSWVIVIVKVQKRKGLNIEETITTIETTANLNIARSFYPNHQTSPTISVLQNSVSLSI